MDILSHAVAGAVTGACYGMPIQGAIIAVFPDLVLGIKRKETPTILYDINHSWVLLVLAWSISYITTEWVYFYAILSHLYLDIPTHGRIWGARLFFPFKYRIVILDEWEWFNKTWWIGITLLITWIVIWIYV